MSAPTELTKDHTYYFEDGNCILRVENHLFNLHRTILRRNSVFFSNMFSLPQACGESQSTNGDSDDHPIACDDSAQAFRAWCWALYAGFNELLGPGQPRLENFDEETFAHIGLLAHKYECDTIEEWARQKLDLRLLQLSQSKIKTKKRSKPTGPASPQSVRAVKPPEGQPQSPENLPIKVLEYLIGTSTKCNWVSVKKRAEQMLLDTIGSTPTPGKSDHIQTQLREVLESADALGDDGLKARAYYVFLRHMKWTLSQNECRNRLSGVESPNMRFALSDIANSNLWCDSLYALTDAQKICLYRGFLGLMALRNQLRVVPEVGTKCACWAGLKEQWKIFAQKDGLPDDPKLFIGEAKNAISWGLVSAHAGECGRTELLREVDNFLKEFDACLVNFFPAH